MSRDISHFIANLNSLDPIDSPSFSGDHSGSPNNSQGSSHIKNEQDDELSIFANTQFFDFDMGRSTDIAVTVDDLLMQQEKLLQNPKGKPHPDDVGGSSSSGNNGSFYNNIHHGLHHINQYPSHQLPGSSSISNNAGITSEGGHGNGNGNGNGHGPNERSHAGPSHPGQAHPGQGSSSSSSSSRPNHLAMPFDFASLQQFSIANELPPHSIHHSPSLSGVVTPLPQHNASIHGTPIISLDAASAKLNGYSNGGGPPSNTIKPSSTTTANTTNNTSASTTPNSSSFASTHKRKSSSAASSKQLNRSSTSNSIESPESPASPSSGEPKVAEEDKRRRNTAASARFRIKKKLREQEMERNARDLLEKVQQLETKVMQLEMENRWLKNLVVEKNEARDVSELLNMRNRILGKNDENNEEQDVHS